jgi:hypothetical protein
MALTATDAAADGIVFPRDAGILNVRELGARGDGRHDDTAALQKILDEHPTEGRIVYLPNGVYLISGTLRWPNATLDGSEEKNTILQGQSREKTILRLEDACNGFDNPQAPRPMIRTGSASAPRFRNAVRDLTIDAGRNNPGAIALQFMANQQGCVRDVTIRSTDGRGRIGLDMSHSDGIGPLLVKNLRVIGFDFGIRTAHAVNSMTFEHVTLENQARFGFVNEGQCVSIRDLTSRNAGPALVNAEGPGLVTLVGANLAAVRGATGKPAILNEATIAALDVTTVGYRESIHNAAGEQQPRGHKLVLFVSGPAFSLFDARPQPLALPILETPELPWDDLRSWASPTHFGARPDDDQDDTAAIQAAIDSGKTTVYFPRGLYHVRDTVLVRKNVRRLIGCEAHLEIADLGDRPGFRVVEGTHPILIFERIQGGQARTPTIENVSRRTLVVRDCDRISGRMTGRGDVFLEDVGSNASSAWWFGRQKVWARQLSVGSAGTHLRNEGGTLWILGLTTERGGTLVETVEGGQTEIVGGLCRTTTSGKAAPMFVSRDSSLGVSIGEICVQGDPYETLVRETRGGASKELRRGDTPRRAGGSLIPFFSGSYRR